MRVGARTDRLCGANNDVQDYWTAEYPAAFGKPYEDATMVFFTGSTSTGCGQGSSETGPFYCPADERLYIDLDFLVQLQDQFGAPGDLATQYIVAHELGHHIQNLIGQNAVVEQATGDRQRVLGSPSSCRPTATPGCGPTTPRSGPPPTVSR